MAVFVVKCTYGSKRICIFRVLNSTHYHIIEVELEFRIRYTLHLVDRNDSYILFDGNGIDSFEMQQIKY
jgi:hypothetical protein